MVLYPNEVQVFVGEIGDRIAVVEKIRTGGHEHPET
jgi:hypothetical protein